jgi:hypothetical protein
VHYFHVVFTLPSELHPMACQNRRLTFDLLFEAATAALLELGRDPKRLGAQLGITAVLHTWTRELRFHPHVHCIVTGGGLSEDGTRWVSTRPDYLFPVRVLGSLFRGKFLAALIAAREAGKLFGALDPVAWKRLLDTLYRHRWVVYCKPPFGGADQLFAYLGRYTHRVAISNTRLVSMDEHGIRFKTRNGNSSLLEPVEFLRRFVAHVLPPGLVADSCVMRTWRELLRALIGLDLERCPQCGQLAMRRTALPDVRANPSRAPPALLRSA